MVAILAAALAVGQQQIPAYDFEKVLTFHGRAAPLKRLIPELSKAAGIPLSVGPELENEVVLLSFDKKSVSDVMKRLAYVVRGGWQRNGNWFELGRSDEQQGELDATVTNLTKECIQQQLDQLQQRLQKWSFDASNIDKVVAAAVHQRKLLNTLPEGAPAPPDLDIAEPLQRATWRVAIAMGADWLQRIRENETIVYSSRPGALERPMAEEFTEIFTLLNTEERNLAASASRAEFVPILEDDIDSILQPETGSSRTNTIQVCFFGEESSRELLVSRIDASGDVLDSQELVLGTIGDDPFKSDNRPRASHRTVASLVTSPVSRAIAALGDESDPKPLLGPSDVQVVLNPEVHEPLSYLVSDILLAATAETQQPICARLADRLAWVGGETLSEALDYFSYGGDLVLVTDGDWRLGRPDIRVLRSPAPREQVGELLRAYHVEPLSFERASRCSYDSQNIQLTAFLSALLPSKISFWDVPYDDHLGSPLPFLSSLESDSWHALLRGGTIPVDGLDVASMEYLTNLVLPPNVGSWELIGGSVLTMLPNGYRDAVVSLRSRPILAFQRVIQASQKHLTEEMTEDEFAEYRVGRSLAKAKGRKLKPEFVFRWGRTTEFTLILSTVGGTSIELGARVYGPPRFGPTAMLFADMPDEVRSRIESRIAELNADGE